MKPYLRTAPFLLMLVFLLTACAPDRGAPPWQIDQLGDGSTRVFGLVPGRSTLADAPRRFGPAVEAALFETPEGTLAAEAYYSKVSPGGLTGKLVLSLSLDDAALVALKDHSSEMKILGTGNKRLAIAAGDAARLQHAVIRGMTFVPTANLDEKILLGRFGQPDERVTVDEDTTHWLYPSRGLDVALNRRGKDLLQYVHPDDFDWVRSGLKAKKP